MFLERFHTQNAILGASLQASSLRNDVISNNIANAEVPGFKRRVVDFETSLDNALRSAELTGRFNLNHAETSIRFENPGFRQRMDGNNTDIETEMVSLYQNSVRYESMVNSLNHNYTRLNLVLNARM